VVAWSLLVAVLLLTPGDTELSAPQWLATFTVTGGDKLIHGLLFLTQAALLERAWPRSTSPPTRAWLAVLVALLYGLALEGAQEMVPGRGWQWSDVLADGVGAALWPLFAAWRRA